MALGLLAVGLSACETERGEAKGEKTARLEAQAKITRADAEKIALDKVPGGTVKEGEIEKEKGKLVWSFDIATAGASDITEIQVDALSGEVVSVSRESAAKQEQEKKEDAQTKEKDDDEQKEEQK